MIFQSITSSQFVLSIYVCSTQVVMIIAPFQLRFLTYACTNVYVCCHIGMLRGFWDGTYSDLVLNLARRNEVMYALHANYLSGNEKKAKALDKYGLWLATESSKVLLYHNYLVSISIYFYYSPFHRKCEWDRLFYFTLISKGMWNGKCKDLTPENASYICDLKPVDGIPENQNRQQCAQSL